jgi:rubrerythrin
MFTAQDILEIAIRLEQNGEQTYLAAREHTTDDDLKDLLTWIAQQERAHAAWFIELRNRLTRGEDHQLLAQLSQALVEDVVRGQSFSLQEVDFTTIHTPDQMVRTFIGFEDDTIAFYEVLKGLIDDPATANQLDGIVAEEKKHIAALHDLLPKRSRRVTPV